MATLDQFTNKYQVQKTLRFRLIPNEKTKEHITKRGFIDADKVLNEKYHLVKPLIDNIHKAFIDETLKKIVYNWQTLGDAIVNFKKSNTVENKNKVIFEQEKARKTIVDWFEGKAGSDSCKREQKEAFKKLFGKEIFNKLLINDSSGLTKEEKELVKSFDGFTTYFMGFNESRKNIYSKEAKSTAVAFRIVNDNFSKFLYDCETYSEITEKYPMFFDDMENEYQKAGLLKQARLKDIFNIGYYNNVLGQEQIDIFNQIIGGIAGAAGSKKLKGINEVINIAMQQNKEISEFLKHRKRKMSMLFKQILSDRNTLSFVGETFTDEQEVILAVAEFSQSLNDKAILKKCKELFEEFSQFDDEKIYINNKYLSSVSQILTGNWNSLRDNIFEKKVKLLGDKPTKKQIALIENNVKNNDFAISIIKSFTYDLVNKEGKETTIMQYANFVLEQLNVAIECIKKPLPKTLKSSDEKALIKSKLDALQLLLHLLQPFKVTDEYEKNLDFYDSFDNIYQTLENIIPLYNKVRNFVTKKTYSIEKFRLNFSKPTLANGWDKNKENEYCTIILLKDNNYFLGIMNPYDRPDIENSVNSSENNVYKKMLYKQFQDFAKMMPKCSTQMKEVHQHFEKSDEDYILGGENFNYPLTITKEIYDLNNVEENEKKKFQIDYYRETGDYKAYRQALNLWINFAKDFISKYKSTAIYDSSSLLPTDKYERLDEFYSDLNNLFYGISYESIPVEKIDDWVKTGKLYLFQIYNKDFSDKTTGKPNIHTLYWKSIFDPQNLQNVVIKLNGHAGLFFRPKSDIEKIYHKEGSKLVNRKCEGKPIDEKIYKEIYSYVNGRFSDDDRLSPEAKEILPRIKIRDAKHDIVKDKRYLEEQYFFHVPITLNFKQPNVSRSFNENVQSFLRRNKDINIIGLDRGERNLIYAVVINQKGEIVERQQISFNTINEYDYYIKLEQREKERISAKQSWEAVGKIKELKEGYLSLVIRKIADMMVKYNAIVVMENLNKGFKRIRGGISEKSVYQKFEKMLIDKLNYLVFKERLYSEPGSVLKAYQLTDKFESFEKMSTQCGFLFYVPAAYTSKIDPTTGFANIIRMDGITNKETKKDFICKFDSLRYNSSDKNFELVCNLDNFKTYATSYIKSWELCIKGKRIIYDRQTKSYVDKYPAQDLKNILDEFKVLYSNNQNIIEQLKSIKANSDNIQLFDTIYRAIAETLQMRNSNRLTREDYIISPVRNKQGNFFDSRNNIDNLPKDADANGAYHIALKGLYLLKQINEAPDGKKIKMTIPHEDWFKFMQSRY